MVVNRNPNHIPKKSYPALSPQAIRAMFSELPSELADPLVKGLVKILNKQAIDERLNYDVIESALGRSLSLTRFSTLVVAASDSSDDGKANADYVCDGSDDHLVLQQAFDDLNDSSIVPQRSGEVVLLEGHYNINAPVVGTGGEAHLRGMGQRGTILQGGSGYPILEGGFMSVRNCSFSAGDIGIRFDIISQGLIIEGNLFDTTEGIVGESPINSGQTQIVFYLKVLNNNFHASDMVLGRRMFDGLIHGNVFENADLTIGTSPVADETQRLVISSNHFQGDISLTNQDEVIIAGNSFNFNDILMTDCDFVSIVGNNAIFDLTLDTVSYIAGSGNVVYGTVTETAVTNRAVAGNVGWT